jgi:RNA polymerase sigma-70 factor (ECF subfamily)
MLVAAAKRNPRQFARLYDRHVSSVYKYLLSRTGKQQLAEDLTADTFLSALEALADFKNTGSFSAWLFTIARNKLMDYFRQNGKQLSPAEEKFLVVERDDTPLDQLIQEENMHQVQDIVHGLEQEEVELLRLRFAADLKYAEIGEQLGKSEDAVKKSLYRLLKSIRTKMEVADVCR